LDGFKFLVSMFNFVEGFARFNAFGVYRCAVLMGYARFWV